jgi:hypothetical protein
MTTLGRELLTPGRSRLRCLLKKDGAGAAIRQRYDRGVMTAVELCPGWLRSLGPLIEVLSPSALRLAEPHGMYSR